jgi:TRAP-type C4-dicarboxylate transport system substrate-binding protein
MKIVWGMLKGLEEYQRLSKRFDERIQDLTNGEVQIEMRLFDKDPSNPLKEITSGVLDLYQITTVQLRHLLPEQSWLKSWEVPFLFKSDAHVEAYIASQHTQQKLKGLDTPELLALNYSYAGGFCSVVTKRKEPIPNFESLNTIEFSEFEYEDMSVEGFLENIYQRLPSNILSYEIHELLKLKPENKCFLNIDVTRHVVVARISMLSKAMLSKIPTQYRDVFVTTLNQFLDEERQAIYDKAKRNVDALQADGIIGCNEGLNQELQFITGLNK